jgi:hypothetical protein
VGGVSFFQGQNGHSTTPLHVDRSSFGDCLVKVPEYEIRLVYARYAPRRICERRSRCSSRLSGSLASIRQAYTRCVLLSPHCFRTGMATSTHLRRKSIAAPKKGIFPAVKVILNCAYFLNFTAALLLDRVVSSTFLIRISLATRSV